VFAGLLFLCCSFFGILVLKDLSSEGLLFLLASSLLLSRVLLLSSSLGVLDE